VRSIINALVDHTPIGQLPAELIVVIALFVVAGIVSKLATRFATYLVDRSERRRRGGADEDYDTGVITGIRQRETAISLIETSVRYLVFGLALLFSIVALSGAQRLQTIAGASFLAIVIGFAAQRFLTDVIAGLLMFFEGWFRIGDTVAVDALKVQGVVESVSLRSLRLRSITGEILYVPNSAVNALRVIPRGFREVELEFFTSKLEAGQKLVEQIARVVPVGPTRFIRRPTLTESEKLDDDLYRITARCAVTAGREWLVQEFLPALLKERAAEGLLIHGPIITYVDDQASHSFARAMGRSTDRE
jgi:small conductance mechanosensitive channel